MPDPTERFNKVPKTKRVRKRNMSEPLSRSTFDEFKKVVNSKPKKTPTTTPVKIKKIEENKRKKKENIIKATPPPKRKKTKEEIRREILKSNQDRIKRTQKPPKKGKLMGSGKKAITKKK